MNKFTGVALVSSSSSSSVSSLLFKGTEYQRSLPPRYKSANRNSWVIFPTYHKLTVQTKCIVTRVELAQQCMIIRSRRDTWQIEGIKGKCGMSRSLLFTRLFTGHASELLLKQVHHHISIVTISYRGWIGVLLSIIRVNDDVLVLLLSLKTIHTSVCI